MESLTETVPVSIVIPAYNSAKTIRRAVESALVQAGNPELIVVDDGSTDETVYVVRSLWPSVTVLTGTNCGPSHARNRGLSEASRRWTIFLDADDILLSGSVSERLRTAREREADVVICDWAQENLDTSGCVVTVVRRFDWVAFAGDPQLACATSAWAQLGAVMFRRDVLLEVGGFKPHIRVAEDARLLFDMARHGARFVHSPHVGAHYHFTAGSQSRASAARFAANLLTNLSEILDIWRHAGALTAERRARLADGFNLCERGLFAAGDPRYFEAFSLRASMGGAAPLHSRIAGPLARTIGLAGARRLLSMVRKL